MRHHLLPFLLPAVLLAQAPASSWKADLLKARREKDAEFKTGKASPLAGIQRLVVESGKAAGLRAKADGLELGEDATAPVQIRFRDGAWLWCEGNVEKPMAGGAIFDLGRFHVQGQVGPDRITLLVFDPERPAVKAFQGLRYFLPSRAFAVSARLEPFPSPETITLGTTRNLKKAFTQFARVHFQLGGKPQVLVAYKAAGDDTLFIPFTDPTTGVETYTVGRFLEVPLPKGDTFTLDFNLAFNPLCNYSGIWNCPLPPDENALKVAVKAGEKAYPHD